MRQKKRVEDSLTEQQFLVRPTHVNHYGRLFGGELMKWIDELAGIVSRRHANANITTAAVDNLQFKAPVYGGQMVVLVGRVTYTGKSSMEVRVDSYTEDLDGTRRVINRAYVVMVAIDEQGNPIEVPELIIETPAQELEYEAALKRRKMRQQRRLEGF
ncbi:MAG: acyl-CoA thioesterase [Clostridiales bacterium]|nr:acyl-CoA thioesterase [Clostridiales bacterium]